MKKSNVVRAALTLSLVVVVAACTRSEDPEARIQYYMQNNQERIAAISKAELRDPECAAAIAAERRLQQKLIAQHSR